ARIRSAGPDLVIALARHPHGGGPALPVVRVLRPRELRLPPTGAEVDRDVDATHREIAGPGGAAQLYFAHVLAEARAVGRAGDDRAHRHRFEIAEIVGVGHVAGNHRLDGDAIRGAAHAGAVVHLVAHPNASEPL